jgi:hypothetical protein
VPVSLVGVQIVLEMLHDDGPWILAGVHRLVAFQDEESIGNERNRTVIEVGGLACAIGEGVMGARGSSS